MTQEEQPQPQEQVPVMDVGVVFESVEDFIDHCIEIGFIKREQIKTSAPSASRGESVTNVEGGANRPTLDGQPPQQPIQSRVWKPSDAAMRTARDSVTVLSIPIHLARYRVRKAEQGKPPTSAEWLRWLLDDEQKAVNAQRSESMAQANRNRKWFGVAGDE